MPPEDIPPERCVLSTKSFTAKLAILLMTAHEMAGRPEAGPALVEGAADEIERFLSDDRRDLVRRIAEAIYRRDHLFAIGRGPSYPLALEAALKVKEVSYVHAEGFAGGELKHGVIALIEPGTPCLVTAPCDETFEDIIGRGAGRSLAGGLTGKTLLLTIVGVFASRFKLGGSEKMGRRRGRSAGRPELAAPSNGRRK